ncbi:RagB/SusD family nutrient uptake outer membrane protein [Pontibacter beigongshangensis]|uniref:RagB/SusD family nutrient uptake outer membrane protein n=1 Tax=Pontibacter beigongshangensis TaxID=2574733 RepID=UPI0016508C6A|nr:RagB/SusD family nutrient uptake outer membrane protein [Pontibacter beigongshangensis]
MKLKYYILASVLCLGGTSCKDFLDTEPTNFIAPNYATLAELETALAGVYDVLGSQAMYGDVVPYWLNVSSDIEYTNTGQSNTTAYIYTPADAQITNYWKTLYQGIYRANLLLAVVDNPEIDEAARNKIKGQALFLRAYYYFQLVSNYGDVPLLLTDKPSISAVDIPRTPMREVYDMVIRDMTEAEALVEDVAGPGAEGGLSYGGRVSRSAVQGILARVNLKMAGFPLNDHSRYTEALAWAKKVRDSGRHGLNPDYTDVFMKYAKDQYDVRESIWEVEFFGNNTGAHSEYTYYVGARGGIRNPSDRDKGISGGSVLATRRLFDLYEKDAENTDVPQASPDLRRDWNIAPFTYVGNPAVYTPNPDIWRRTMGKWRREYEVVSPKDISTSPQNFPILRYSDVLLMIAEAENELNGPTAVAYEAINEVRRRAYGLLLPNPPKPDINADLPDGLGKEEFREILKDERAREFCFEASRRPDLIRWGNFIGDMKSYMSWALANGAVQGHVLAQTNVSERNLLLPIPTYDMALNKALTQNPGY